MLKIEQVVRGPVADVRRMTSSDNPAIILAYAEATIEAMAERGHWAMQSGPSSPVLMGDHNNGLTLDELTAEDPAILAEIEERAHDLYEGANDARA